MIRALVTGRLLTDPQPRTGSSGRPFVVARLSVKQDDGWVSCSIIAFDAAAARLLDLKAGAAASVAGALKVGTWQAKDGTTRPALDLVADEVASTTPRPRKRKEKPASQTGGDPFGDMPGAGDVDWLGA